jgi:hypothetical protein
MSNRSAKFVAALFASILAGANLTSVADIHAQAAADNCLTAPKEKTPAGSHWYYRLERGTKRQCWYLRDENDKSARAAPQDSSTDAAPDTAAADPAPPPPRPTVRKSVANAHAELTSAQQRVEQEPAAVPESRTVGMAPAPNFQSMAPAPSFQNSPAASAPDTTTPSSTVAARWPDASGVNSSNAFRTAAAEPQAAPPETNQAATPPAPVALAAADSSMAKQSASMQMLFLVMAGALALAGIIASLIYRFGRARARRPKVRNNRRAIWDSVDHERSSHNERSSPSMLPDEGVPMWRRDAFHDPRAPDDPDRRLTEMLSRLARSAQS